MITINELLTDKQYREFFRSIPNMPSSSPPSPPWRLYVQQRIDGSWARKEFWTYREAFNFFVKLRKQGIHDASIQSKAIGFRAPSRWVKLTRGGKPILIKGSDGQLRPKVKLVVWKPKLPYDEVPHTWCIYCRRPTVFRYFKKHHAFPNNQHFDLGRDQRCTICGASLSLVMEY